MNERIIKYHENTWFWLGKESVLPIALTMGKWYTEVSFQLGVKIPIEWIWSLQNFIKTLKPDSLVELNIP